jgi:hypothetical protein
MDDQDTALSHLESLLELGSDLEPGFAPLQAVEIDFSLHRGPSALQPIQVIAIDAVCQTLDPLSRFANRE